MTSKEPDISIEGPYTDSGQLKGPETKFYIGESATADTDSETQPKNIPGREDEESILSPLQGKTEFSYKGGVNPHRLVQANYGSTLKEAVHRYLFELETLPLTQQGAGYRLKDNLNGYDISPVDDTGVLVKETRWEFTGGEGLNADWTFDAVRVDGVQPTKVDSREVKVNDRFSQQLDTVEETYLVTDELADFYLGVVEDFSYSRSVDINAQDMLHNYDVPQMGIIQSGVQGEIRISGTVTEQSNKIEDGQDTSLDEWARTFNEDMHGRQVFLTEEVTNRQFKCAVSSTNTEFSRDLINAVEYDIEFDVGTVEVA